MFILGHLGVGSRILAPWSSRLPRFWLLFGTQLPDLIDKPLYYFISMANRGAVGTDLGLISSSRTLGHTAILLLGITGLAMARKSKILAAIALGTATHLLLDNLGDRLMDPQHSSSALSALIFPLNGFEFAISPFKSFSDHMISIPNRFTITGEILGALILLWDQWKLNHRSEILIRLRKRLRRRR